MKLLISIIIAGSAMIGSLAFADGKELYEAKCAKCHGATGDGSGRSGRSLKHKPTKFNDAADLKKISDDDMFKSIKSGGEAVGQSKEMEGFPSLKDDQIKELIPYIKTLPTPEK